MIAAILTASGHVNEASSKGSELHSRVFDPQVRAATVEQDVELFSLAADNNLCIVACVVSGTFQDWL